MDEKLRLGVEVSKSQFGFMPGREITNPIFILRQMAEKYKEKQKKHILFADLGKAYDRISRQELWKCLRERKAPEKIYKID